MQSALARSAKSASSVQNHCNLASIFDVVARVTRWRCYQGTSRRGGRGGKEAIRRGNPRHYYVLPNLHQPRLSSPGKWEQRRSGSGTGSSPSLFPPKPVCRDQQGSMDILREARDGGRRGFQSQIPGDGLEYGDRSILQGLLPILTHSACRRSGSSNQECSYPPQQLVTYNTLSYGRMGHTSRKLSSFKPLPVCSPGPWRPMWVG